MESILLYISISDINLRAALGEGGGRMWPPGRQLPTLGLPVSPFYSFLAQGNEPLVISYSKSLIKVFVTHLSVHVNRGGLSRESFFIRHRLWEVNKVRTQSFNTAFTIYY